MRQNLPNVALFLALSAALLGGGYFIEKRYFPPPPPPPVTPPREAAEALAGAAVHTTAPVAQWRPTTRPAEPPKPTTPTPAAAPAPPKSRPVPELVALGDTNFFQRALLTTVGGAVQQVTLRDFEEANRLGREVRAPDGHFQPLRLIPGRVRPRDKSTLIEPDNGYVPDLAPGKVGDPEVLAEPSYVLLHYPSEDDPARTPDSDRYPSPELGERAWNVVQNSRSDDGTQTVVFQTTLDAPYHLRLTKTFTLSPGDYHLGFTVSVEALPGRQKRQGRFRYQVVGPRGMPVEGEWYAQTYRNVYVGSTGNGTPRRTVEDALTIHTGHGGAMVPRTGDPFTYAAVGTQYFASALAVDEAQPADVRANLWDYVRPTREPHPWDAPDQLFLGDVTFRAVALPLDPAAGETVLHKYHIYNGPMKVRLLKQPVGNPPVGKQEPDPVRAELVDRYLDAWTLKTLTDYESPTAIGRFARTIGWSSLVIASTNLMHTVLGFLHRAVPSWGLCIILLTVMVRLLLFPFSRRQQASMAAMQAKQLALKPEMDKLAEKYKDDPSRLQQEKTKLMFANGVNPLSAMGGCLLLFAQMPIFMGLYFCLQESVFFRQQPFLGFIRNLAAPDMVLWWSEKIPFLSTPESLGGAIYLGPYLNVLPLIAVGLIFLQQYLTMPPPADEQAEMQQKMMKFMVLIMAVFFYKVPAGLTVYFICSTAWAIAERKFIKKPEPKVGPVVAATDGGPFPGRPAAPAAPATGWRAKLRAKVEEMQRQADEQAKRQIRNDRLPRGPGDGKKRRR